MRLDFCFKPQIVLLFPLAPEKHNLNNFALVFSLVGFILSVLSIRYGLLDFSLPLCCHADKSIIHNMVQKSKV